MAKHVKLNGQVKFEVVKLAGVEMCERSGKCQFLDAIVNKVKLLPRDEVVKLPFTPEMRMSGLRSSFNLKCKKLGIKPKTGMSLDKQFIYFWKR